MRNKRYGLIGGVAVIVLTVVAAIIVSTVKYGPGSNNGNTDARIPAQTQSQPATPASPAAWKAEQVPIPSAGFITAMAVSPNAKDILYAGGDVHGFKFSDNAGESWQLRESGLWKAGGLGIAAIAPHPKQPGKLYMLSGRADNGKSDYGLYSSEDDGKTWTLLNKNLIPAVPQASNPQLRVYGKLIALDTSEPQDTLYVASYDKGLFKSEDGGKTFKVVGLAGSLGKDKEHVNLTAVVLDPRDPQTVYVGVRYDATGKKGEVFEQSKAGGAVWRSTDGGATWLEVWTGVPVRDLDIDPNDPQTIYAACLDQGMYRSTDGGGTWQSINHSLSLTTPKKGPLYYNTVTVNPKRKGEVLVGTGIGHLNAVYGSVFRSTDAGNTWTNLIQPSHVHVDPGLYIPDFYHMGGSGYAVSIISIPWWDPNTIYVAGRSGIWVSNDNGDNWRTLFTGLQGRRLLSTTIVPGAKRFLFGMVDFSMGSFDTATGKFQPIDTKQALGTKDRNIAVAVDAVQSKMMAGVGNQYVNEGNYGSVIASTDSEHWMPANNGLPDKRISGLKMAPSNPDIAYAALKGAGIYRTTDGGSHWTKQSQGLIGESSLFSSFTRVPVAVHPQNPDIAYVLDDAQGVYRTNDGGKSWAKAVNGIQISGKMQFNDFVLDPTNPAILYVSSSKGLYQSPNGGDEWKSLPSLPPGTGELGALTVDPRNGNVFVAIEADSGSPAEAKPGIYLSVDKGATWSAIYSDGAFGSQFDALLIDPEQPDVLYATERSASLIKLTEGAR
jgi:photosystem II stability/assembly factor-like uncharacterized protein